MKKNPKFGTKQPRFHVGRNFEVTFGIFLVLVIPNKCC